MLTMKLTKPHVNYLFFFVVVIPFLLNSEEFIKNFNFGKFTFLIIGKTKKNFYTITPRGLRVCLCMCVRCFINAYIHIENVWCGERKGIERLKALKTVANCPGMHSGLYEIQKSNGMMENS